MSKIVLKIELSGLNFSLKLSQSIRLFKKKNIPKIRHSPSLATSRWPQLFQHLRSWNLLQSQDPISNLSSLKSRGQKQHRARYYKNFLALTKNLENTCLWRMCSQRKQLPSAQAPAILLALMSLQPFFSPDHICSCPEGMSPCCPTDSLAPQIHNLPQALLPHHPNHHTLASWNQKIYTCCFWPDPSLFLLTTSGSDPLKI